MARSKAIFTLYRLQEEAEVKPVHLRARLQYLVECTRHGIVPDTDSPGGLPKFLYDTVMHESAIARAVRCPPDQRALLDTIHCEASVRLSLFDIGDVQGALGGLGSLNQVVSSLATHVDRDRVAGRKAREGGKKSWDDRRVETDQRQYSEAKEISLAIEQKLAENTHRSKTQAVKLVARDRDVSPSTIWRRLDLLGSP